MIRKILPVVLLSLFWSTNAFAGTTAERLGGSFWLTALLLLATTPLLPAAIFFMQKTRKLKLKVDELRVNIYFVYWGIALLYWGFTLLLFWIGPTLNPAIFGPHLPVWLEKIICAFLQLLGYIWTVFTIFLYNKHYEKLK